MRKFTLAAILAITHIYICQGQDIELTTNDKIIFKDDASNNDGTIIQRFSGGNLRFRYVSNPLIFDALGGQPFEIKDENGVTKFRFHPNGWTYLNGGKVGIGNAAPFEDLTIGDRWAFHDGGDKIMGFNYRFTTKGIRVVDGPSASFRFGNGGDVRIDVAESKLAGTDIEWIRAFTIRNDGNIGIGVPYPTEKLDVEGDLRVRGDLATINFRRNTNPTDIARIRYEHNNTRFVIGANNKDIVFQSKLDFGEVMRIKSNGNIGIGTADPLEKLTVWGSIGWGSSGAKLFSDQGASIKLRGTGTPYVDFINDATSGYDMRFILMSDNDLRLRGGNLTIGNINQTNYKLAVDGKAIMEEVVVKLSENWPDYVFSSDYQLKDLEEVKAYIKDNHHLPGVPSAKEVEENGIALGEMNTKLLEKVEELMLYTLQQEEKLQAQQKLIKEQQQRLEKLEKLIEK